MKFYTYDQNNSGGRFDFKDNTLSAFVIIEAESADDADRRFCDLGGYFNGCEDGLDCSCCGDRWYPTSDAQGTDVPSVYGEDVSSGEIAAKNLGILWIHPRPE